MDFNFGGKISQLKFSLESIFKILPLIIFAISDTADVTNSSIFSISIPVIVFTIPIDVSFGNLYIISPSKSPITPIEILRSLLERKFSSELSETSVKLSIILNTLRVASKKGVYIVLVICSLSFFMT